MARQPIRAWVTGGSRGVGLGIAEGLAETGAEVWVTGRDPDRLQASADAIATLGGTPHIHAVDHRDDAAVAAIAAAMQRSGPLDVLVNSAWGGYEGMVEPDGRFSWPDPLWQQPLRRWDAMFTEGVRAAVVAAQAVLPGMIAARRGLVVNVSFWAAQKYVGNALYGMAKAATDKLTADLAYELAAHDVAVVSLYPGLVRTDRVMASAAFLDLSNSESPRLSGRVVAALATDPALARRHTGSVVVSAALARERGIRDVDGASPHPLVRDDA